LRNMNFTSARYRYLDRSAKNGRSVAFENTSVPFLLGVQRRLNVFDADSHLYVQVHEINNATAAATTYYNLKDSLGCSNVTCGTQPRHRAGISTVLCGINTVPQVT
jgi:hypothetical protein